MGLSSASSDRVSRRTAIITRHLTQYPSYGLSPINLSPCISYPHPVDSEKAAFDTRKLRQILDEHDVELRDRLFRIMEGSSLFCPRRRGTNRVFVMPDYDQSMEEQREMTVRRIQFLVECGFFDGLLTRSDPELELRSIVINECLALYDHSLFTKLAVHFLLCLVPVTPPHVRKEEERSFFGRRSPFVFIDRPPRSPELNTAVRSMAAGEGEEKGECCRRLEHLESVAGLRPEEGIKAVVDEGTLNGGGSRVSSVCANAAGGLESVVSRSKGGLNAVADEGMLNGGGSRAPRVCVNASVNFLE